MMESLCGEEEGFGSRGEDGEGVAELGLRFGFGYEEGV